MFQQSLIGVALMHHEKCYTSCPVVAETSLCIPEYLQIKLAGVGIRLIYS